MPFPSVDRSLYSADVVQIRRAGETTAAFPAARPMKATVSETGQLMSHPLENGSSIIDHRILFPINITIAIIIDPRLVTVRPVDFEFAAGTYRDTYNEIRTAFRESQQFEIQTKSDTYRNMFLQNMPHDEVPEQFDTITMVLEFTEARFSQVLIQDLAEGQTRDPNDTSTLNRGEQPGAGTGSRGSILFRLFG